MMRTLTDSFKRPVTDLLWRGLEKTPGWERMGGAWALGGKGGEGGIWDMGRDLEEGKDALR